MACKSIQSLIGFRKFNILIIKSNNLEDKNRNVKRDEEVVNNLVELTFKLESLIRIRTQQ